MDHFNGSWKCWLMWSFFVVVERKINWTINKYTFALSAIINNGMKLWKHLHRKSNILNFNQMCSAGVCLNSCSQHSNRVLYPLRSIACYEANVGWRNGLKKSSCFTESTTHVFNRIIAIVCDEVVSHSQRFTNWFMIKLFVSMLWIVLTSI